MKQKAIIIDLDGTLTNYDHRLHFLQGKEFDWKSFTAPENMMKDTANPWCSRILWKFDNNGYRILLISERSESLRKVTEQMIYNMFYAGDEKIGCDLFLRQENDCRPEHVIKEEIYLNHIKDNFDVLFVIDNRKSMIDMWRRNGLVALQCAEG